MGAAIDTVSQDIRYAWRSLRKSPGFTFFAVSTIALGLGANAAIFSLVDGVLLKSAGYPEPERIVRLWEKEPHGHPTDFGGELYRLEPAKPSFDAMAAKTGGAMSYTDGGAPQSLHVGFVSAPYFRVFGVQAALGRTLQTMRISPARVRWWSLRIACG